MQTYDVAVIGGGLVGCAAAYYLAGAGARVALIERGGINQGASGQNAGSLHFQLEHRLIQHRNTLAAELEHYVALTQMAIAQWRDLEAELDCDLELGMHGGLMVAETPAQVELLQQKAHIETGQGLQVELLDGVRVRRLAPYLGDTILAALFCPAEGHCNPRLLTPAYAQKAAARGAEIFTRSPVNGIRRQSGNWQIEIGAGTETAAARRLAAAAVLNAAGAWSPAVAAMANLHLPLFPVGLTMNVTERTAPLIPHLVQHVGRKLSMKQVRDGNILIGGGWSAHLWQRDGKWHAERAPVIDPTSVYGNLAVAAEVVPAVETLHLVRTWTGTTGITPDQLPIIGEVSRAPGFYVAAGGSGFTYGPSYAQLISELILKGETSFPLAPYSPDRFGHINMFMG
ncbi:FAD-binding oxidoreductase [Exilibacterium tricleocarpae]|uniref:FAD-binding oxidoreductase n=1 Tax=Exilibacterium tricleocarpae TaxID=2591008 RepID=A0A545TZL1_9GAMM|nr:FAD-binding oxidoreductase [Exilibacterium tricleocarpae]TQV82623.1 FAD-binding oxidoreductase [Exilibacterium tricleocarpae]